MSEASGTPTRHVIKWQDPEFTDAQALDLELQRVFDICHGCRRCFNLCDSFPRLFDLIDSSKTGELDSVESKDFGSVVEACTLCDMCFMTKCPYVPPHEFDLDFPHLMLRARAVNEASGKTKFIQEQVRKTDRNGALGVYISGISNWIIKRSNFFIRWIIEYLAGINRRAYLPVFAAKNLITQVKMNSTLTNKAATGSKRKVVLFATCIGNYNKTNIGLATLDVLSRNGIEVEVAYPGCCGMPQWETGNISKVAEKASKISAELCTWIDKGYDVVALTPSCALMLKFEWPLILPDNRNVKRLSYATSDVAEYVVSIANHEGLVEGLQAVEGSIALHLSCHSRAQNIGPKASELLQLIPGANVEIIQRCSGHGGAWGVEKNNFEVALKVGKPTAKKAHEVQARWIASECPLAAEHILQGIEEIDPNYPKPSTVHPIEIFAYAYGYRPQ